MKINFKDINAASAGDGGRGFDPAYDPEGWDDDDYDYDDDEENQDETNPFVPGSASTPYHGEEEMELHRLTHEQSGLPDTSYDETSFGGVPSLGDFIPQEDKPALLERAKEFIKKKKLPKVNLGKLPHWFR